jgi:hypothetical protein
VDLFAGNVTTEKDGEAIHTVVKITTNGEPVIRVTPFSAGSDTVLPTDLDLSGVTDLEIANLGLDCISENIDYLLHFLTQEGGIPRNLKKPPLGFGAGLAGIDYAKSFEKLIAKGFPDPLRFDWTELLSDVVGTSLSCSDSRYP